MLSETTITTPPDELLKERLDAVLRELLAPAAELEVLARKKGLSAEEVEKLYGIPTATLKTWRCRGRGPKFAKDGCVIRYGAADLAEYFAARTVKRAGAELRGAHA